MNWMRVHRAVLLFVMSVFFPASLAAQPRAASAAAVLITVQREAGVVLDDKAVRELSSEIERIWSPYLDVTVSPRDVPAPGFAGEHIRLIITTRTPPGDRGAGVGWIQFVGSEPQPEINVSTTAALRLMASGRVSGRPFAEMPKRLHALFQRRALSMAAAHELGHYILQMKTHARTGLMRATFTFDEIMNARATHVRLESPAIGSLRKPRPLIAERSDVVLPERTE